MNAQFASVSKSTPFFKPNIWIERGPNQNITSKSIDFFPNEDLTIEKDEIQNNFGEPEDR